MGNWVVVGSRGIGQYHFRDLEISGEKVIAIVGQTEKSSGETAKFLEEKYCKRVKNYWNVEDLLEAENFDSVVIATPPESHYSLVKRFILEGKNVFCEKPLVTENILSSSRELFDLAREKGVLLRVNNQWPSLLRDIDLPNRIDYFKLLSEPGVNGKDLLFDHLSHANSLLIKLIPRGEIKEIKFGEVSPKKIEVKFLYSNVKGSCEVEYVFCFKKERPRRILFEVNGEKYERIIGENYKQYLRSKVGIKGIEDPFSFSVKNFVEELKSGSLPLNSEQEILENAKIQEELIRRYINL